MDPSPSSRLDIDTMKSFGVAKLFSRNTKPINAIDFSSNGELAVTSSNDNQINVFDCMEGKHKRGTFSNKYGAYGVCFTHAPSTVLYASTMKNNDLRYLSLHDNKFIRYYSGHTDQVMTIAMSPINDGFLTSSKDKSFRLWDLRSPRCEGLVHLLSPAVCGFDPPGLIFAMGSHEDSTVRLFDHRQFERGPFCTFALPKENAFCRWNSLSFSPDGKKIMINTSGPYVRVIDAFQGDLEWEIDARVPSIGDMKMDATFSANSEFILCASSDGKLNIWKVSNGEFIATLNPFQPSIMGCVKFNPKYGLMMTALVETAFWIPRTVQQQAEEEESLSSMDRLNEGHFRFLNGGHRHM